MENVNTEEQEVLQIDPALEIAEEVIKDTSQNDEDADNEISRMVKNRNTLLNEKRALKARHDELEGAGKLKDEQYQVLQTSYDTLLINTTVAKLMMPGSIAPTKGASDYIQSEIEKLIKINVDENGNRSAVAITASGDLSTMEDLTKTMYEKHGAIILSPCLSSGGGASGSSTTRGVTSGTTAQTKPQSSRYGLK